MRSSVYTFGKIILTLGVTGSAIACSRPAAPVTPPAPAQQIIVVKPPPPPGVNGKCWQEPQVRYETEGPGVDVEGKWYRPHHQSVRMVKGGRWIDCAEAE